MSLYADENYIINIRRELHRFPEIGYDLPKTLAIVKRELEKIGLSYTEEYGKSSVVSYITPPKFDKTVALRADMDALPVEEKTDLPFKSEIEGQMHACGHDAHTAVLLGVAKTLCKMRDKLNVRVKLIFQPDEEGEASAADILCKNGIMDDVDMILGLHVDNTLNAGEIGICKGASMASCRNFTIEFFGKTAHAAQSHTGADALSAAVDAYVGIQTMLSRKINPKEAKVCSIGALNSGNVQNVVPDYAKMVGTVRTYNMQIDEQIYREIQNVVKNSADNFGCKSEIHSSDVLRVLYNDEKLCNEIISAASEIVGAENVKEIPPKMSSEDFADYLIKTKGVFFRVGTGNQLKKEQTSAHCNDFVIEESGLKYGADTMIEFVMGFLSGRHLD